MSPSHNNAKYESGLLVGSTEYFQIIDDILNVKTVINGS